MAESPRAKVARLHVEQAEQRAMQAAADLERATARLINIENEPGEPKRGSIIKFRSQFTDGGIAYTYVAFRAPNGQWYRTGSTDPLDWEGLTQFMYRDVTAKRLGLGFVLITGKEGRWIGRERG